MKSKNEEVKTTEDPRGRSPHFGSWYLMCSLISVQALKSGGMLEPSEDDARYHMPCSSLQTVLQSVVYIQVTKFEDPLLRRPRGFTDREALDGSW